MSEYCFTRRTTLRFLRRSMRIQLRCKTSCGPPPDQGQRRRLTPVVALAVSGMNDVLNSQGYTQAAWWNRIPVAAWVLMAAVAIGCNLLLGYIAHRTNRRLFLIAPVAVSFSFFLIAEIDSPRWGVIRVAPHNLISLSQALHAH